MKARKFKRLTDKFLVKHRKQIVSICKKAMQEAMSPQMGVFGMCENNQMSYSAVGQKYNGVLFNKLPEFMRKKINEFPEMIYVIYMGPGGATTAYFLSNDEFKGND